MPWNETTRKQYSRETGRYESDLTDAEWALLDLAPVAEAAGQHLQQLLRGKAWRAQALDDALRLAVERDRTAGPFRRRARGHVWTRPPPGGHGPLYG